MNPKVSVIIGLYNYARFVRATVKSICKQTFDDWELLIIDDASTDDPYSVLKDLVEQDSRIQYFRQPINKGISHTRNVGIRKSKGEYITYVDADDMLTPKSLAMRVKLLDMNPETLWVHGRAYNLLKTGKQVPDRDFHGIWKRYRYKFPTKITNYAKCIHSQSVMVRRKFYEILGLFDEDIDYGEEQDLWRRALAFGYKPLYVNDFVCVYRHHSGQTRFRKGAKKRKKRFLELSNQRLQRRLAEGINPNNTTML